MVSLKSEDGEDSKPLKSSPSPAQDELKRWEKLAFTFDMDHNHSGSSRAHGSRNNHRSASSGPSQSGNANRDAALLAQFAAANSGMNVDHNFSHVLPPGQYPSLGPTPGFYGNFFHHDGMVPANQLPPLSNMDFPWPHMSPPPQQHGSLPYHQGPSVPSSPTSPFIPSQYPVPPPPPQMESSTSRGSRGRSVSSTDDMTEAERAMNAEEKRRRNTAASARFRIKKKQKTVNLERSVSDLTGRAEELEREVSDLRRENGWLKEIVMLKGTRYAATNPSHRTALNQAAALAIGQGSSDSSSYQAGSGVGRSIDFDEESEDDSDSEGEEDDGKKGGKKADSSGRRK